jgi:hypothetical protein
MKKPTKLEPSLNQFHWKELANLHLELRFCRHRLIQRVNEKIAADGLSRVEDLDNLAQVDELLQAAVDRIEEAKAILFDLCYDSSQPAPAKTQPKR